MDEAAAYALAYSCKQTRMHFYIPTVPEARKWRGPYPSWAAMVLAMTKDLGEDVGITTTTVRPEIADLNPHNPQHSRSNDNA